VSKIIQTLNVNSVNRYLIKVDVDFSHPVTMLISPVVPGYAITIDAPLQGLVSLCLLEGTNTYLPFWTEVIDIQPTEDNLGIIVDDYLSRMQFCFHQWSCFAYDIPYVQYESENNRNRCHLLAQLKILEVVITSDVLFWTAIPYEGFPGPIVFKLGRKDVTAPFIYTVSFYGNEFHITEDALGVLTTYKYSKEQWTTMETIAGIITLLYIDNFHNS
jgi:hypothetical protein